MPHPELYSIKRHGTSIDDCDKEPVQTPGCIQPHGVLLVLRKSDLTILQASENSAVWLGVAPQELLEQNLSELLGPERTEQLRALLAKESIERNPVHVFSFVPPRSTKTHPLDFIVHSIGALALLECESTEKNDPAETVAQLDHYSLVNKTLTRFQQAATLKEFCQTVTEEIRNLTRLDRVMVYRFHADDSGEVFAESRREDLNSWLGFRYPAHDIPKPAREIFRRIWIRPVPDIKAELAEIVPLANPDTHKPLEMTHCFLRGPSVMYTEYLANMGVTAAFTMSILYEGKLWGLIACHHYSGPRYLPYQSRAVCEFVAKAVSLQLKDVQDREFAAYRQKLNSVHDALVARAGSEGSLEPLVQGNQTLLDGIDAGGIAILHRGLWQTAGKVPSESQLTGLAAWLNEHPQLKEHGATPFATDTLPAQYPPAKDFAGIASGLLAISIAQNRRGLILWFRPETIQTFTWGGNPNELPLVAGPHGPRLTPRKSFELWRETVHNRSLPWKAVEIEAAARLQTLIINFVVKHAEELEELNALLVDRNDELEAFAYVASHDLKEPLRGIHKYASQLGESPALSEGSESKERLEGITRLAVRMDDLINALLHYARVSRSEKTTEGVDLNLVVREAIEMLGVMVDETGTHVDIPRLLPTVECDRIRTREIFANLISNGIKYNDQAQKELQIGCIAPAEQAAAPERHHFPTTARGQFIFYVKDNGIGIEKRHHETIFRIFKRLHGRDAYRGGSGAGLAIVKRLIDQHGGVIWLESEPKRGTTFYFTLSKEQ